MEIQKSDTLAELAKALAAFQEAIQPVKREESNPFYKSKYADLAAIVSAVREPLAKQGLSVSQLPLDNSMCTILMHTSGEYLMGTMAISPVPEYRKLQAEDGVKLVPVVTPQAQGSAITYARRYALSAILGIATEADDDGNAASAPTAGNATASNASATPAPRDFRI